MTRDVAGLLLANGVFCVAGMGVCAAAGWWRTQPFGLVSLGLAYVAGVAAWGVLAQSLYVVGAPLTRWQVVALGLGIGAVGAAVALVRSQPREPPRTLPLRVPRLLAVGLAALLGLFAVDLWFQPHWSYDAWTLWTPKARALVELDGLEAGWFTSAGVVWPDYPLLLPAVEAAVFRFAGYAPGVLDLQSWLLLAGLVVAFLDVVGRRAPGVVAWAAVATLVAAPTTISQLAGAVADVPLAVQFSLGALLLLVWVRERQPAALVLAAVLLAGASATKVEGLTFALAAIVALVVVELAARRSPLVPAVVTLGAVAVAVVPWRAWLAWHDVEAQASLGRLLDLGLLARQADYLPETLSSLAARAFDPLQWLLALPFVAVVAYDAFRRGSRAPVLFVGLTATLSFAALVLAYWTTPFDLDHHLATSARRVITPIVVLLLLAAPLLHGERRPLK